MAWQNEETYVYDETNHMVDGKNEKGEHSLYTYNGLGLRVGRELIMQDNTHGYTDFHDETPSVETGLNKPEVAVESYVIDYTSPTFRTLTMEEEGGFDYRWVYGLDKLSVKITSEGTNWWGQNVKQDILKDYLHQDRLGNTTNLTDKFGRVVGRADYNEWGEITYKDALDITSAYRRIYPQLNYTGHDWDDVLEMYYAKARFYDPDAKRFVEIDPVKGQVTDPLSLVSYLYCVDNPLRWVDPLGLVTIKIVDSLNRNHSFDALTVSGEDVKKALGTTPYNDSYFDDQFISVEVIHNILAPQSIIPPNTPLLGVTNAYFDNVNRLRGTNRVEIAGKEHVFTTAINLGGTYFVKLSCVKSLFSSYSFVSIGDNDNSNVYNPKEYTEVKGAARASQIIKNYLASNPEVFVFGDGTYSMSQFFVKNQLPDKLRRAKKNAKDWYNTYKHDPWGVWAYDTQQSNLLFWGGLVIDIFWQDMGGGDISPSLLLPAESDTVEKHYQKSLDVLKVALALNETVNHDNYIYAMAPLNDSNKQIHRFEVIRDAFIDELQRRKEAEQWTDSHIYSNAFSKNYILGFNTEIEKQIQVNVEGSIHQQTFSALLRTYVEEMGNVQIDAHWDEVESMIKRYRG